MEFSCVLTFPSGVSYRAPRGSHYHHRQEPVCRFFWRLHSFSIYLPGPRRIFLWQELLNASLFMCPPKTRGGILRTMTQLPCESKLAPDPSTGRLMWVQWSKDRHLSSGVLLYSDSNNSFWYFSSWLRFWTRAWTCVLGRGRVELRRDARHAAWWMKGRKSQFLTGFFSARLVSGDLDLDVHIFQCSKDQSGHCLTSLPIHFQWESWPTYSGNKELSFVVDSGGACGQKRYWSCCLLRWRSWSGGYVHLFWKKTIERGNK